MGLDMYLVKKTYVKRWDFDKPEEKFSVTVKKGGKVVPKDKIDPEKISYVESEVGTWRKANQIHNWFIENCADGVDDCKPIYVSHESLEELLDLCEQVLKASVLVEGKVQNGSRATENGWEPIMEDGKYIKNPSVAEALLPTTSGFFFGNTEYNEWYLEDIKDTIEILKEALSDPEASYEYQASW